MNVATYGYTILTARLVGPSEYGAFAACLSLLIVLQVLALGLQATAARRIAVDLDRAGSIERTVRRLGVQVALGAGAVLLLLAPAIDALLNLDSLITAVVVALAAVPLTLGGAYAGILQGARQWRPLSAYYLAGGLPRVVIGTAIVWWRPDATSAVVGVALGLVVQLAVVRWALHRRPAAHPAPDATADHGTDSEPRHPARALLVETAHNSQVLLAFFALSGADIVLARRVLSEHDAGLYAAGLIMTKVLLFLPQFVVVVAFPDMATPERRRRALLISLGAVGAVGVVAVVAARLLSGVAMVFVGGAAFADVETLLWAFAVLGTLLAMIQLQVYAVLARQARRTVVTVWAALLAVTVLGLRADSIEGMLAVVIGVDAVLLVVLTALAVLAVRREEPTPVGATP